jgi:3-oxoacyl-[acyl-carrier protein] reductase
MGVGRAIAIRLGQEGADVVVNYSKSDGLAQEVLCEIERLGANAIALQADVSKASQVDKMVSGVLERFGHVDILVNNAGIWFDKSWSDTTEEIWDKTVDVDLKSAFLCIRRCAGEMIKHGGGKIINISSIGGLISARNELPYDAAKAGLLALTRAFALELGPHNITVNAIAPGIVETSMTAGWLSNPRMRDQFVKVTPLGKIGKPEDIAGVTAFLASADSDFVTGQVIVVDGGIICGGLWSSII